MKMLKNNQKYENVEDGEGIYSVYVMGLISKHNKFKKPI